MLVWQDFLLATWQTIYTVYVASVLGMAFGLCCGIILYLTQPGKWWENFAVHQSFGMLVNVVRSVPFIILLIAIVPFTRFIVGSSIGVNAAMVPLVIVAIAFYARLAESALADLDDGLLQAADAMGLTHVQAVVKILLPNARSVLIHGAALTIISLIGYAAMAGAIGGGGLGQLAIDYGYERFNPEVMLLTVLILIALVQVVQWFCNRLASRRKSLRGLGSVLIFLFLGALIYQNWPQASSHVSVIRLGVMSGLEQDAIQSAVPLMKKQYDINLKLVTFDSYAVPNAALSGGDIDANLFQHKPFLDADSKAHGYHLTPIARTFLFPLGFYSKRIRQVTQLASGDSVAVANDPSNQGRALLLLQKYHLITVKASSGLTPSLLDITSNPLHLKFKAMAASQLPRVMQDADLVALNNAFLKPLKLTLKDSVLHEGPDAPYANILVIKGTDTRADLWKKLITVLHSKAVIAAYKKRFPSALVAW